MSLPILKKFIGADQIDQTKVLFSNDSYFRARNAANSADINVFKVNASDHIEFASQVIVPDAVLSGAAVNKGQLDLVSGDLTSLEGRVTTLEGSMVTVQSNISTLQSDVSTLQSDLSAHINDTVDAHDATAISFVDNGNFPGVSDVQAAIYAVDTYITSHVIQDDGSVAMAASLNLNSNKIINLADATTGTDAANLITVNKMGGITNYNNSTAAVVLTSSSAKKIRVSGTSVPSSITLPALSTLPNGLVYTIINDTTSPGYDVTVVLDAADGGTSYTVKVGYKWEFIAHSAAPAWRIVKTPVLLTSGMHFNSTISVDGNYVQGLNLTPVNNSDATPKKYVDDALALKADASALADYLKKDGSVAITGNISPETNDAIHLGMNTASSAYKPFASVTANNFNLVAGGTFYGGLQRVSGQIRLRAENGNDDVVLLPSGTGVIRASSVKISDVADPSSAQDAATKNYADTQDALKVSKAGDSMSGNLAMNGNKVIGLGAPTSANDAIRLVDLQNAQAGMDYQANVDGVQVDNTLVPTLAAGKRYVITNASSLHANFGSISGLGNGDIVQYNGSSFDIVLDVSTKPAGSLVLVGNRADDQQYEWKQSTGTWDIFYGFSANAAGIGLTLTGNVLDINLGAGIAELPSDEVGVDVHASGALILTEDGTTESSASAAQLAVKLDGSTLSKSTSGLKVADAGITDTQISSSASITLSKLASVTPNRALASNGSGVIVSSNVTDTELSYVSGVTSSIQDQLDAKADSSALADYVKKDGSVAMTGSLDLGSNQIINLADPTALQQAATKAYVDAAVAGFNQSYVKESFTLSAGDITNGYVDLANEAVANSVVGFIGRLAIHETEDYTISVVSSKTRITFGSLIGAGPEAPVAGDKLFFTYSI